jgi:hypothetical protein
MRGSSVFPRRSRSLLALASSGLVLMSLVGVAAPASADGVPPPTPQTFAQCPVDGMVSPINKPVQDCLVGVTNEGTIDIGGLQTTFHGPGVVQGGLRLGDSFSGIFNWSQALDGSSYSAPPQLLAKPVMALLGNPPDVTPPAQAQVYAVTRQAGPILFGVNNGLVTVVPLTFQLKNPLLGPNCTIGPVTLTLTTGTSGSLTGSIGQVASTSQWLQTIGTEVVDGQFSVPGATGCGPGGSWDDAIDSTNALPSPSGSNQAILYGNFAIGLAGWVERNLGE